MVVHLRKQLVRPPDAVESAGISIRTIELPQDVEAWLALRAKAIAGLVPAPRPWMHADYEVEMFDKPWWNAEHCWLAAPTEVPEQLLGTVTLAQRTGAERTIAVVHWLLVDPDWRRRGIGKLLMSRLELSAWSAGWCEIQLETHTGWTAAMAFYQSMGYAPLGPPPRR